MKDLIAQACAVFKEKVGFVPEMAMILGSGLSSLAGELKDPLILPYADLPGFPVSLAPGHVSELHCGTLEGMKVVIMKGRFHLYDGYPLDVITFPVRFFKTLGCQNLLLTNACGGVRQSFKPGTLMQITDHINFTGQNPLIGPNDAEFGPRFPDMSYCWEPRLNTLMRKAAAIENIPLSQGVYMWFTGPSFETPAEIKLSEKIGGDVVGMSTVPEAIVAAHCALPVIGVSCVTNMAAGILDQPITSEEVLLEMQKVRPRFARLLRQYIKQIQAAQI